MVSYRTVLLVLVLAVAALAGTVFASETQFPIVDEPISIKMVVGQHAGHPSFADLLVYQEYEKMTGIAVEWEMIPTNVLTEKKNLMLVSGEYPHAFHSARLTAQDLMLYGSQGIFIPLNDLIEEHAPNFRRLLEENPDLRRGITMPDGNIYAFPRVFDPEFTSVLAGAKLWINTNWLQELNMENPETLDEFYAFLVAVKENDLNGNGEADEVPLVATGDAYLFHIFRGAFGLGNRGFAHEHVDLDPQTGGLRFIPTSPEYKALLEFLHKIYAEGLLNQDLYTLTSAQLAAKAREGVYGAIITTNPLTGYDTDYYEGALALEGPFGDKLYANVKSALVDIGAFVITDTNPYPAETVRWVDYFYSDEGAKLFFMGIEGLTYQELPDGSLDFTDLIYNHPEGLTMLEAVSRYIPYRNGAYPAIVKEAYFKGSEGQPNAIAAAERLAPYYPEVVWAPFPFNEEENDIMATIGTDIDTYVKEMRAKFVVGQESLDNWDNYVRTLQRMGLDIYMRAYQSAYQRYSNSF